jgi:NAD(P)-dependent dehydrogenase (short-subunit alcohol dehydrogenase family)
MLPPSIVLTLYTSPRFHILRLVSSLYGLRKRARSIPIAFKASSESDQTQISAHTDSDYRQCVDISFDLVRKGIAREDYPEIFDRTPLRREQTVEEVAGAVVLLSSEAARSITGQSLMVDGGMVKI